jgi:hypothetical protein
MAADISQELGLFGDRQPPALLHDEKQVRNARVIGPCGTGAGRTF